MGTKQNRISDCKKAVDDIAKKLGPDWQNVRKECGQWSWNGQSGSFSSSKCATANAALRNSAYYILPDGSISYVTVQLTESIRLGLWKNIQ